MSSGWIGVDLDGTLAEYTGWIDELFIGKPIPIMVDRIKAWRLEKITIKIMTARAVYPEAVKAIEEWCQVIFGETFEVTDRKDFQMIELWDDRVRRVELNTGKLIK